MGALAANLGLRVTVELATSARPGAPAYSGPAIGRKQLNFFPARCRIARSQFVV